VWSRRDVRVARRIVPDERRMEPLLRYVGALTCRRELLLRHFGERVVRCAGCDQCRAWRRIWRGKQAAA
jgi:superfamily II DNA helicase RecQ